MSVTVQREDFDSAADLSLLTALTGDIGAVASFMGIVRGCGGVSALCLEHYPGMTERVLGRIEAEALARWPLAGSVIRHRVGRLLVGERIVWVAVASAHRRAAFEACAFIVDHLKTRAPFWKAEERLGRLHWVEARAEDEQSCGTWGD